MKHADVALRLTGKPFPVLFLFFHLVDGFFNHYLDEEVTAEGYDASEVVSQAVKLREFAFHFFSYGYYITVIP